LLAHTGQTIRNHLRDPTVGAGVAPEFMPKRNSEPIVNRGRIADDAARLHIGETRGWCLGAARDLLRRQT